MGRSAKIAITLPEELLESVERARKARGQTRSEFLRCAAEDWLRREQDRDADDEYARAYREQPDSEDKSAEAEAVLLASAESINREYPWDDE